MVGQKGGMRTFTAGKHLLTENKLVMASNNPGKVVEIGEMLRDFRVTVITAQELGITPVDELTAQEGGSFAGNARLKADSTCAQSGLWTLADDSGLEVAALNELPGVDTAHYGGVEKLLKAMEDVPEGRRDARFRCVLALARPGHKTLLFEGTCEGVIAREAKGTGGFGYDPVFIPKNNILTFAEMASSEKKKHSHRGMAMKALTEWWQQHNG